MDLCRVAMSLGRSSEKDCGSFSDEPTLLQRVVTPHFVRRQLLKRLHFKCKTSPKIEDFLASASSL